MRADFVGSPTVRRGMGVLLVAAVTGGSAVLHARPPTPSQPVRSIPAPTWRVGDWWRVRVPLQINRARADGGAAQGVRDSPTESVVYRFEVLEPATLRYEEHEGPRHIGQAVPPEECWMVRATPEPGPAGRGNDGYLLYFRKDDRSLRQIVRQSPDGRRRDDDFLYYSTALDEESRPKLFRGRGPHRESAGPIILDWPVFPLTPAAPGGTSPPERKTSPRGLMPQSVRPTRTLHSPGPGAPAEGLRVTLGLGGAAGSTVQDWAPGYPWWIYAERDGLLKSQLIETYRGAVTRLPRR